MICHAVLAIKQSTVQAIRTLLQEGAVLTENQRRAIDILKDFRQELKSNGTWFKVVQRGLTTYYVFSQLLEFSDLAWLEAEFPNAIVELYIGDVDGKPLVIDDQIAWLPSGPNAIGFTWLVEALRKQDPEGRQHPVLHMEHWPGGWKGPDVDAWRPYVGEVVWII